MEEMIALSIDLHLFMIGLTVLLALYNIFASFTLKDEVAYINRMKYLHLQYMVLVSTVVFTGITVMAVNHFVYHFTWVLMIVAVSVIYFTSIKKHIHRKHAHTDSESSMARFRSFVKKKYIADIGIIAIVTLISFALRS